MDNEAEPMREVENPHVNGEAEGPTPMLIDPPKEVKHPEPETLPTPPSSCELEDLPAIFDLPSDVIYASVNELPKKDGSSLSQLPIYGPPVVTDEPYHNPIEDLPIVPISKFCLERYVVPVTNWEPPNRHYRRSTPEYPDDMLDIISTEVQVEAIPTFAPAGTGATLLSPINSRNLSRIPSSFFRNNNSSTSPTNALERSKTLPLDPRRRASAPTICKRKYVQF